MRKNYFYTNKVDTRSETNRENDAKALRNDRPTFGAMQKVCHSPRGEGVRQKSDITPLKKNFQQMF